MTTCIVSSLSLVDFGFCLYIVIQPSVTQHIFFCLSYEFLFIFCIRCCFGTVWINVSRLSTAIVCAFSQFISMCENFLKIFFCSFLFLLSTLVLFPGILFFRCLLFLFSRSRIIVPVFSLYMLSVLSPWIFEYLSLNIGLSVHLPNWNI